MSASTHRKAALPRISKRWARALRGPSPAWRDLVIGCSYEEELLTITYRFGHIDVGKTLDAAAVVNWLTRRSG